MTFVTCLTPMYSLNCQFLARLVDVKMKKLMQMFVVLVLWIVGLLTPACGQSNPPDGDVQSQWQIKVGAAVLANSPAWQDNDVQGALVPYFSATYGNWSFGVENLVDYTLPLGEQVKFSFGAKPRANGFEPEYSFFRQWSDAPVFDGYEVPDTEFLVYSRAAWHWLSIGVSYDVADSSGATTADVSLTLPVYNNLSGSMINITLKADLLSQEYVNYYYGLKGKQINLSVGRNRYQVEEEAVNASLSAQFIHAFSAQWSTMLNVSHTRLDELIVNSPLVDESSETQAVLAVVYRF